MFDAPRQFAIALSILAVGGFAPGVATADPAAKLLSVTIDFPGGSGQVLEIDQAARRIRIVPTPHKDRGWDCWWYVRVDGISPGETIELDVSPAPWATPDCAAVSTDNRTWIQTDPGTRDGKRIVYRQQVDTTVVYFAWGPPFLPDDAQRLCESAAAACPQARAFTLCRTRQDRPIPALRLVPAQTTDAGRQGIWIQARQHAWESGSSWVCRGFVEWLVSDDPPARRLREGSQITVVPIMDIDNVAIGAGGKQQRPQDHNRDWSDHPHWPSVAAAQRAIRDLNAERSLDLFVDLHNPGANERRPYFYTSPRDLLSVLGRRNLDAFIDSVKKEMTGPLAFRGQTKESGPGYDKGQWKQISKNWVTLHCEDRVVAVTLETAWNTPHSTTDGYRTVGRQLGLAIERYLRESARLDTDSAR